MFRVASVSAFARATASCCSCPRINLPTMVCFFRSFPFRIKSYIDPSVLIVSAHSCHFRLTFAHTPLVDWPDLETGQLESGIWFFWKYWRWKLLNWVAWVLLYSRYFQSSSSTTRFAISCWRRSFAWAVFATLSRRTRTWRWIILSPRSATVFFRFYSDELCCFV